MTTEKTIALAREKAEDLAGAAAPVDLLFGVVDQECGRVVLADLLAHELVASHRLMQRIAAATDGMLSWSAEVNGADEATGRPAGDSAAAEIAAARLAGVAGRLMEQVRLGLVVLRRLRPDLPADDDGIWVALTWNEERCSPEELDRRLAAAKAAKAAARAPGEVRSAPKAPPLSARAQAIRRDAMAVAAELAREAGVGELAVAVADEGDGLRFLGHLFAFELGAVHDLTMRLAGCADRAFDHAIDAEQEPVVALQLSTVAARLGDRFRRGLLTLQQQNGGPDKPRKIAGTVWAGPERGARPNAAANDPLDSPAAPAAALSAGHGVHRSDSGPAGDPGNSAPQAAA